MNAIEQMAGRFGWKGKEKYNQAVKYFTELAGKAGIKFSEDQVRALIEAAVLELKKGWEALGK